MKTPVRYRLVLGISIVAACTWWVVRWNALETGQGNPTKPVAGVVVPDDLKAFAVMLEGFPADEEIWSCVMALPKGALPEAVHWLAKEEAMPEHSSRCYFYQHVASALYFRWASVDPVEAATAASKIRAFGNTEVMEKNVLCAWMKRDPYRAYESTIESFGPPKLLNAVTGSEMFVSTWETGDVLSNLKRYPDKRRLLLGVYCDFCAMSPARREALIRLLDENPRMAYRDWARERLLVSWAKFDPAAAADEAKRLHLDKLVDQLKNTRKISLASSTGAADAETEAIKADLLERFYSSPDATHDWELWQETWPVLARLGENDLRTFYAELADDDFESCTEWRGVLNGLIGSQWSRLNPVAAASLVQVYGRWRSPGIDVWLRRDFSAARAWLDETPFPPEAGDLVSRMKRGMLEILAERDYPAALALLGDLDAENRKSLLKYCSWMYASHPERRSKVLAEVEKEHDKDLTNECHRRVVWALSGRDAKAAGEFVASLTIDDEAKHDLNSLVLSTWAEDEPEKALAAWIELRETKVPDCFQSPLSIWCSSPERAPQAVQWVIGLKPSPQKEMLKEAMAAALVTNRIFPQAANLSLCIADEEKRKSVSRSVIQQWKNHSLTGYMKWFSGLNRMSQEAL